MRGLKWDGDYAEADALLAVLADAGYPLDDDHVVVPREPTEAQVDVAEAVLAAAVIGGNPTRNMLKAAIRAALHTPGEMKQ